MKTHGLASQKLGNRDAPTFESLVYPHFLFDYRTTHTALHSCSHLVTLEEYAGAFRFLPFQCIELGEQVLQCGFVAFD